MSSSMATVRRGLRASSSSTTGPTRAGVIAHGAARAARPARGARPARPARASALFILAALLCLPAVLPLTGGRAIAAGKAGTAADFRFAFIGDRTGSATPGVWESVIGQIEILGPEFVISVGDHIEGYTEDPAELEQQWTDIEQILHTLTVPYYPCPGNHDITSDGMLPAWKLHMHRDPCYSFEHEGVHFIILDTSRWESSETWMAQSGYADWLRGDLQKHRNARLTVVVFHKPYWYNTLADGREDLMHRLFVENGVDYVFNGHFHNYGSAVYDGIHYTILGSSGGGMDEVNEDRGMFFQYTWCAVRGDSLAWRVIRPEAVLPEACVPVSDLKFLEEVATRYIDAAPFGLPDPEQMGPGDATISIRNVTADPWTAELRWEPAPGWTITPATASVPLEPEVGTSLPFTAERHGPFYPLPRLRLDYPYRAGHVYKYDQPLRVLRTQPVLALRSGLAAPVMDGRLEDACWSRAIPAVEFGDPSGNACSIEPTSFYFARDAENLYLAARCIQIDGPPRIQAQERDGTVHRDDCVGYFLCADPAGKTVFQIYSNAAGTIFDQKIEIQGPGQYGGEMAKWNGEYTVMAGQAGGEWTVEMAIPFSTLGATAPAAGDRWRVNFRRKEMSRSSSADWQYPINYEPTLFGYLLFSD